MNRKLSALWQWTTLLGLGLCALLLRLGLNAWAVDSKGLLVPGHICEFLLWPVSIEAVICALLPVERRVIAPRWLPALGGALGALGLLSLLLGARPGTPLQAVWLGTMAVAAAALVFDSLSQLRSLPGNVLPFAMLTVFLVVHLLTHYRLWSGEPQLINYLFSLLASLCFLVFTYCRAREAIGKPGNRARRFVGLLAVFFCLASLAGNPEPGLYLGLGAWVLTGLEARQ